MKQTPLERSRVGAIAAGLAPLLVVFVFVMLNSRKIVGAYRNPLRLNIGLVITFIFTLFMSYAGLVGLVDFVGDVFGS